MPPQGTGKDLRTRISQKLLNKTFYRFLFSFIAVIAGVLLFILVLGASVGGLG